MRWHKHHKSSNIGTVGHQNNSHQTRVRISHCLFSFTNVIGLLTSVSLFRKHSILCSSNRNLHITVEVCVHRLSSDLRIGRRCTMRRIAFSFRFLIMGRPVVSSGIHQSSQMPRGSDKRIFGRGAVSCCVDSSLLYGMLQHHLFVLIVMCSFNII